MSKRGRGRPRTKPHIKDLKVEPELASLLDPLLESERTKLYAQLDREGIRHPLVYAWIDDLPVLLDGHNRLRWWMNECQEVIIIPLEEIHTVSTMLDAKLWIDEHQRGRRNLTARQRSRLEGLRIRWLVEKESEGLTEAEARAKHAEVIRRHADSKGRSLRATLYDEQYALAIQEIEKVDRAGAEEVDSGKLRVSKKDVIAMVKAGKIEAGLANLRTDQPWSAAPVEYDGTAEGKHLSFAEASAVWNITTTKSLPGLQKKLYEFHRRCPGFPIDSAEGAITTIRDILNKWRPVSVCNCESGCPKCHQTGWKTALM